MNNRTLTAIALLMLAAPFAAQASDACSAQLSGDDMMKFDKTNIDVPKRCRTFTINFRHAGRLPRAAMGHNVVVASTADLAVIAADGIKAGAANDYLKPNDSRVVAHSAMVGGGETTSVSIPVARLASGAFGYTCTFPGHASLMRGTLTLR